MVTVYGIPTCGTVKKARAWLDAREITHRFVDLRQSPPSWERLASWVGVFGARPMRNTSGSSFRALGPEKEGWSDEQWVAAFADDPMLIKRPVIERDGRPVLVGFLGTDEQLRARLQG